MALLNPHHRPFLASSTSFAGAFFGRSPEMHQLRRDVELLSQADLPVLIQGESGSGKGYVAELLHRQAWPSGRLFRIDCLSGGDVSSLLSSAIDVRDGANDLITFLQEGGTLLLDGIEELSVSLQGVLLLFLKREFNSSSSRARVRLVSTCSTDLQLLADQELFRRDLLYHINTVKLHTVPLRQRPEDVKGMVDFYLERYSREAFRPRPRLSPEIQVLLETSPWSGNIRQLDNLIKSFISVGSDEVITRELLHSKRDDSHWDLNSLDLSKPVALKEITRQITHDVERQIILKVLQANGWNRQKTAKWLQISYRSLLYKLSDLSEERPPKLESLLPPRLRASGF